MYELRAQISDCDKWQMGHSMVYHEKVLYNYFVPCQKIQCPTPSTELTMRRLCVIPSSIKRLSSILIGCVFYGTVQRVLLPIFQSATAGKYWNCCSHPEQKRALIMNLTNKCFNYHLILRQFNCNFKLKVKELYWHLKNQMFRTDVTNTGNGERGKGNRERESGNEFTAVIHLRIQPWRTKEKKREQFGQTWGSVTVVNMSFYRLCPLIMCPGRSCYGRVRLALW